MAYSNRGTRLPTVLSAKRYDGLLQRSRWKEDCEQLRVEEEQYREYLRAGGAALCKRFPVKVDPDEHARVLSDESHARNIETRKEALIKLDKERQERILKANAILESLKPYQKVNFHALVESNLGHERKYHDTVNKEIEKDKEQQRLADQQCPERLIPFSLGTEEQLRAERKAKALLARGDMLRDLEEKRKRQLAAKSLERFESIVEREQLRCLDEKEKQAAKEQAAKKREFCQQAYRDALKDKASIRKYERTRDQIDGRIRCVDVTMGQSLDTRHKKTQSEWYARSNHRNDIETKQLEALIEDKKQRADELQRREEDRYQAKVDRAEAQRLRRTEELAKQRRAYELEDRKRAKEQRQREVEIKRFKIAERLKHAESNKRFGACVKQKEEHKAAELRNIYQGQRDEALHRFEKEYLCALDRPADPNLKADVMFYDRVLHAVTQTQKEGRPMYPLEKVVQEYRRKHPIEPVSSPPIQYLSRPRESSLKGYFTKADLVYKNYEHRERCRLEQAKHRQSIVAKNNQINEIISEERQAKRDANTCNQSRNVPVRTPMQHKVQMAERLAKLINVDAESSKSKDLLASNGTLQYTTQVLSTEIIPQPTPETPHNNLDKSSLRKCPERHRREPSKRSSIGR